MDNIDKYVCRVKHASNKGMKRGPIKVVIPIPIAVEQNHLFPVLPLSSLPVLKPIFLSLSLKPLY